MGLLGKAIYFQIALLAGSVLHALTLISPAFPDNGKLPEVYSEPDSELSPPVGWADAPRRTATLVLVVDEPMETGPAVIHWIIYNIPASQTDLPEGVLTWAEEGRIGPKAGLNDWAKTEWSAAQTRPAQLRFRLFALDEVLRFNKTPDWASILEAMDDHVLDVAEISALVE